MECIETPFQESSVIGFGGTHYASKFNRLVLERDAVIGHIAPKYALDTIDSKVVSQMVSRTQGRIEKAVIDWKGTNAKQKERLFPMLEKLGIEVIKARAF
jgi:D-aminoacyl-tRNA deacylase